MVIKYNIHFDGKPIRVIQNMGTNSIGPCYSSLNAVDYAAYLCCHMVCSGLWCGRLITTLPYNNDWLDEFIDRYELNIFQYNKPRGMCTFFTDNVEKFKQV